MLGGVRSMRERQVEQKLVKAVKDRGGMCLKFTSPGFDGVPDRIILFPGGHIGFVELKAPGKEMRPLQKKRKRQLEQLGFLVFTIDHPSKIKEVLDVIQTT